MWHKQDGFTLLEMLIVIGMLGILMAATFTGVSHARVQARITKANTEVRQLVGAILAYEAATEEDLDSLGTGEMEATADKLKELLGEGMNKTVFLNVQMRNGAFRDPWGTPYKVKIVERPPPTMKDYFSAAVTFPNRNRPQP